MKKKRSNNKRSNQFGNKSMDTSDYIKNKKQNILFQNVIDNNFKNVNNIIFRSENKSNNIIRAF